MIPWYNMMMGINHYLFFCFVLFLFLIGYHYNVPSDNLCAQEYLFSLVWTLSVHSVRGDWNMTPTRHKSLLKRHEDAYQSADTGDQFTPNTEY